MITNQDIPIPPKPYNNFYLGVAPIYNPDSDTISWNKWNGRIKKLYSYK